MMANRQNPSIGRLELVGLLVIIVGIATFEQIRGGDALSQEKAPRAVNLFPAVQPRSGHEKMLRILNEIRERMTEDHPYFNETKLKRLRAELAALPEARSGKEFFPYLNRWQLNYELGEAEILLGYEREGIDHLLIAYELVPKVKGLVRPELPIRLAFRLGIAYMRFAETQNCSHSGMPDSCIFPIQKGGIHSKKEAATQAIRYFTEVLEQPEEEPRVHLEARWLLNIAYMTVGSYPDQVPLQHLIPPKAFESEEAFPRFNNIAPRLGLNTFSLAGGAVGDDFNDDGYIDLMVSSYDPAGQTLLFLNNRDGTFTDETEKSGLLGIYGGQNLFQADYDNDGDVDVLAVRGGWFGEYGRQPKSLLRNNGDGTFTDVTFEAGLGAVHYPTQSAAWADYDNDGDLDLYVGNETSFQETRSPTDSANSIQPSTLFYPSQLFRNNGDGSFTDVAQSAGVTNDRWAKAVTWGDYDNDRFPDLYVSNFLGLNRLYHNNRDGTFTDVAPTVGVTEPKASFPAWFWDFDNDGNLDLFVSARTAGIAEIVASYLNLPVSIELAKLYHGNGRGGFEEVSRQQNLTRPNAPMGANFGDLDNDGYPDFYLGTGWVTYQELMPNVMYHNRRGAGFSDVSTAGGFGHLQKGHAVVFADFDNDGDQDIFQQMGGALLGDKSSDVFYENPGFGNHWISVKLVGTKSNRSAIGARIRIDVVENGKPRTIYKHVNSGGSFGANPLRQSIGLGSASQIERLEISWPTSGQKQLFRSLTVNQTVQIVEGKDRYTVLPLKTLSFSHPKSKKAG